MIVALPAPCPVTRPVLETVATPALLLAQLMMDPVTTLPLLSFTVALSCDVAPCVSDTDDGETTTIAAAAWATVIFTCVFFLPAEAVTVVVPDETPVTTPVLLIDARVGSPDDQDTVVDIVCPSALRTFAVSCADCFGWIDTDAGETTTVSGSSGDTVMSAVELMPSEVAVMTAVPSGKHPKVDPVNLQVGLQRFADDFFSRTANAVNEYALRAGTEAGKGSPP